MRLAWSSSSSWSATHSLLCSSENTWAESLTIDELRIAWEPGAQNVVKSWSQIRPGFPDEPLGLYGPGVDSGTYDYFTEAVCGEEGASRGDFQASEDDNVLVQGVSNDPAALGFFGMVTCPERGPGQSGSHRRRQPRQRRRSTATTTINDQWRAAPSRPRSST